ncbi:UNVERIFIED_CONTAM: hypothetical protein FKN15_005129 [Acipenser sinensis]
MALCQGRPDDAPGKVAHAGPSSRSSSSSSALPCPTPRKKSRHFKRYHQGTAVTELLLEPSSSPVPLGSQGSVNTDWQQDDMLSLTASEVGKQELAFLSEDVESDSTSPAVKLSCRQSFYH